ncbi:hypothetical protein NUW58_g7756 [Xylaria curta]|uniref:Uncharacterized protein n=1 Tax=Xylaria curta TaxID=42375 RepID=A0ACC1NFM8_9PEZI|nr:hypothetical protein NUW58_g7756 [Xylaria curta]
MMHYSVDRMRRKYSIIPATLKLCIGLLVIDSIIELALVGDTTHWLGDTVGHKNFHFLSDGSRHRLPWLPSHFIIDPVHTSNGAAATIIVAVGAGSVASLWLRNWAQYRTGETPKYCRYFYYIWLSSNVPGLLLTGAALVYVFATTNARAGQQIDVALAVDLDGRPYNRGTWTPQGWFSAVLELRLLRNREEIVKHLSIMKGWQYNLIPKGFADIGCFGSVPLAALPNAIGVYGLQSLDSQAEAAGGLDWILSPHR